MRPLEELAELITAHDEGTLEPLQTLELYGELIETGYCWELPGRYGRTALDFVGAGLLTPHGEITKAGLKASGEWPLDLEGI